MNHTEILSALCELTARERVDFLPLAPDSRPLSDYPPITKYLLDLKNGAKPKERWTVLRTVCADLVALRRGNHFVERLRLEGERLEATRQLTREKKELEFGEWLKRPDVQEKVRPKVTRDRALKRIQQILDHFLIGGPLEDFRYLDDEEPEAQPDPAVMI